MCERFRGKISQIRNSATTVSNVVTYDAVIDVSNEDLRLRPGMTANATVTYADKKDVLAVANAALRFKPPPESGVPTKSASSGSAATEGRRQRAGGGDGEKADAGEGSGEAPDPGGRGGAGGGARGGGRGKGANDAKSVWVLSGGAPVQVPVQVGLSDGAYTEITGGDVKEGDAIILDADVAGKDPAASAPTATMRRAPF